MAVQDYKINYKSDFVLTINGDAGWAVPFCIKFWTGMPSQAYFVGFDGVKYVNCRVGDTPTQLLVMFDDHHLPIGKLKMQIAYHTTIEEFPGSVFDEVTNARDVIVTIDDTDYQVMLDFTGEDAPELEFNLPAYASEAERIQNELQRQQNEAARIEAELQREQATAAAVEGAENVNAQLNGTTLTVTNRNGVSTSVDTKGEQGVPGPVGPEGPQGETGTSIVSFTPKSETTTALIYTVTFSDGTTQQVSIPKGSKGDTGATGPQGPQGETGVSIVSFTQTSTTTDSLIYTVTFSDGTTQQVAIPKGPKGDTGEQGPIGPTGPQGPMGDVAVITTEQQAAFTMYSTTGQNTDGPMTQKAVTENFAEIGDGSSDADLDIDDKDGNAIVRFVGGHVRTKNFNSADAVMNGLVGSQIKRYKRQADDYFIFENVGLIGNWVKRTLNGTNVVSSYSWGSELLFQVKRTTSVSANFILDSITAPVIAYQVDDGEWSTTNVASTISIATGLNAYEHTIRIRVSSCTLNETMYTNGSGMVNFSGLTVDNNALVIPLDVNNRKILFIGDSITGGVGSSVWQGYAYLLADMLNAANIQSALAGGGLVHGSRTYLPTAAQVLREMIQGSNNAINEPDIIFIMLGTNDGSQTSAADFTTGYSNLLKYIRKRFGGCHIFACSPFNGTHQTDTQAATQVIDNVTWIPTTELAGTYSTTDGTHPDVAGAKVCADYCYEKITEVLYLNYFN